MDGWISLHRKIRCNPLFVEKRKFSRFEAWIDMLMEANHSDNKWLCGNEMITIKRGSFITSEIKLMNRWGWSKSKVRGYLLLLQSENMIIKKTDNKKTTICIVNYDYYQDNRTAKEPQKDHKKTTKEPQKDTNNNDNNDNKKSRTTFTPPSIDEIKQYCKERNNNIDPEQFHAFYSAKGWKIGSNKMKDWKQAVITWEKRDKSDSGNIPEYRRL